MSSGITIRQNSAAYISVVVVGTCLGLLEIYILQFGISYHEVIVSFMVLAGFLAFAAGEKGLRIGFVFLILTFALGYRTMQLTPELRVHPAELVLDRKSTRLNSSHTDISRMPPFALHK